MEHRQFSSPKLVLEFFVREFYFVGKGTLRTQFPKDAFFYQGRSKALEYRYFERVHKQYVKRTQCEPELIIKPDLLLLSSELNSELFTKITQLQTNTIMKISGDYLYKEKEEQYRWYFQQDEIKTNSYSGENLQLKYENIRSLAPHHFNIEAINDEGAIITNFPRKSLSLTLNKGETACFICRREEYGADYSYQPALNLVMWVKNHGFYSAYQQLNPAILIQEQVIEPFYMKAAREFDFRNSKLRFELG
ncbi:hypothetical protein [Shigella sp. FC1655]|uniref:hypothetical protein n=2 Tax=Shigella TaxID=620 RepID=UPI0008480C3E|nr:MULTISPECIES: hypothetical protein [unclassified Shigella]ODQ08056.1 hypothetical protein BGK50_13160 [Shigella sp. FC130]OEI95616.1 hypothetical protein BHE86_12135 [Shigella sp. FC1655]